MSEKVAVIGSNSFSGAWFCAHALAEGLNVLGLSRSAELDRAFLPYQWNSKSTGSFQFQQLDLNLHTREIAAAIHDFHPDYVVNFAAQGMVAQSWEHPTHWYQTNVVANVALHDELRKFTWLKKYVHVSTPEVYGSTSGVITEDAPYNPSTPYAASRAACDLHLRTFFQRYQFPWTFTRSANVYGPGQQLYRIIPRTILFIKLGRKLPLHGGGHSVRSFIHIRDVADATLRIARNGVSGGGYHLSTDRFISIRDLVEMICVKLGVKFSDVADVVDDRPGKDAAYLLDATRARSTLGWRDQMTLEDGIAETVRWVDEYFDILRAQPLDYIHKQ
ncbi:MAG TPA: GDP-mannose 4,6-dehydratase [Opitutales bacterium]|jgi:dTDP-glucose 4,6-dehydratase|nr:GDP-mannose 4,6-dehydratase [Opitutales bacterium]